MKKILISALVSTLFATSVFAIEPISANTATGTVVGTTSPAGTVDFYTQMRQVQERLAALKAKNDPTVNVDAIQTELINMQNDHQARINAVINQFRPELEKLNTIPDSALSPTALASKQQMNAIVAQIDALNKEKTLKAESFVLAYTNAAKALSAFDGTRASRVTAVQKLASDTATALTTQYTADKAVIRTSINSSLATIASLSKQITKLEASLATFTSTATGSVSPNYDGVKAQIASLMAQRTDAQKALDAQRVALSDLESNFAKQLSAINATKAKAIAAINAERKVLVAAFNKANSALITVTRPYNRQINALYTKLTTINQPYNEVVRAFMLQNQTARKALSQQMESAVMALQQEYYAKVLAFLKAKGLA